MAELVDARDLKSLEACPRAGSTPALGTKKSSSYLFTCAPLAFPTHPPHQAIVLPVCMAKKRLANIIGVKYLLSRNHVT